jgi:fructuronate reductase
MGNAMERLSNATLANLPGGIERPGYDRSGIATGIVHLGIGAFHRAHQAVYTDALLRDDPRWGILGVSLRSSETRDALDPQDGLYSVSIADGAGVRRQVIGASTGLIVAPEDPAGLARRLSDPGVRIVSTTVTEKGYSHDPATRQLNEDNADIRHDLANLDRPRTTLGTIVGGLKRRHEAGVAPFTVLACDNLPDNGRTLRGLVIRFAELVDADLGKWVADEVRFPSTMVNRSRSGQRVGGARRTGCVADHDRTLQSVGDRRRFYPRSSGLGPGRRRVRSRRRAL